MEHTYFNFVWQMASGVPTSLPRESHAQQQVGVMVAKLGCSFVLETLIHAKEKPTMLQWIELICKQFNACAQASEWFLSHMAADDWWPQQILIRCPNQVVRQMFQRLVIHAIRRLQQTHSVRYLLEPLDACTSSCVTRFILRMLGVMNSPRLHCKHLTEYFAFLVDFAKMGDAEAQFLLRVNAIAHMVRFFLAQKSAHESDVVLLSDDDDDDCLVALTDDKYFPQALEKMIYLVAHLVEKSRKPDNKLALSDKDRMSVLGKQQVRSLVPPSRSYSLTFSVA